MSGKSDTMGSEDFCMKGLASSASEKCTYKDHANEAEVSTAFGLSLQPHQHDHSMEEILKVPRGAEVVFPLKVHYMLRDVEDEGMSHIVSWQPHGRCFVVHRPKDFVDRVLPSWFRMTKLASFQRQLNLYGFQRITTGRDKGGYYHELFLRGKVFLAKRIQRFRLKGTGCRKRASPESEPNFYLMPFVGSESIETSSRTLLVPSSLVPSPTTTAPAPAARTRRTNSALPLLENLLLRASLLTTQQATTATAASSLGLQQQVVAPRRPAPLLRSCSSGTSTTTTPPQQQQRMTLVDVLTSSHSLVSSLSPTQHTMLPRPSLARGGNLLLPLLTGAVEEEANATAAPLLGTIIAPRRGPPPRPHSRTFLTPAALAPSLVLEERRRAPPPGQEQRHADNNVSVLISPRRGNQILGDHQEELLASSSDGQLFLNARDHLNSFFFSYH